MEETPAEFRERFTNKVANTLLDLATVCNLAGISLQQILWSLNLQTTKAVCSVCWKEDQQCLWNGEGYSCAYGCSTVERIVTPEGLAPPDTLLRFIYGLDWKDGGAE